MFLHERTIAQERARVEEEENRSKFQSNEEKIDFLASVRQRGTCAAMKKKEEQFGPSKEQPFPLE